MEQLPSEDDLYHARHLPLDSCPRRYCWWWRTLSFDWHLEPSAGCTVLRGDKPQWWPNPDTPCIRSGVDAGVDHYESRGPHLVEDGFEEDRFD